MAKRFTALLLIICMLSAVLVSCASSNEDSDVSAAEGESTAVVEEEDTWVEDALEDHDYAGRTFKILSNYQTNVGPDEEDGASENDALDDAIWRRNSYVEERFNIKIESVVEDDYTKINTTVKGLQKSGDLEYHVVYQHMVNGASMAYAGMLYNLNKIEEINQSAAWWDKDVKKGFQVEGVLYLTAGDILPYTLLVTACMSFNKTLMDRSTETNEDGSKKLEYPYEMARNGEWTLDQLANMTKDYTKDVNNDGNYDADNDIFGLSSWHLDSPYNFYYGSGCTMFVNNGTDAPTYSYDADQIQKVYDKVYDIFINNNSLYIKDVNTYTDAFRVFSEGRALFVSCQLSTMYGSESYFKKMTDDYGVLPQPKYDASGEYLSFVNGAASMVCVANVLEDGSEDSHFVGTVIEGLANASYNMVTYTLYEVTAKAKNVNDQDSADMVDIIIRNRVFDFGYAHFFSDNYACASLFCQTLDAKTDSIASTVKKYDKSTNSKLTKILKAYAKYSGN